MRDGKLHHKFANYKGRRVFVQSHDMWNHGRLSNWVSFVYVKTGKKGGAYGNNDFKHVRSAKIVARDPLSRETVTVEEC